MKTYEGLEAALAVIEDPNRWCQGKMLSGDRRCALGAFDDVLFNHKDRATFAGMKIALERGKTLLGTLASARSPMPPDFEPEQVIAAFNDTHAHGDVVALFQEAIRASKGAEAGQLKYAVPLKASYFKATDKPSEQPWGPSYTTISWDEAPKAVPIPMGHDYKQQLTALKVAFDEKELAHA